MNNGESEVGYLLVKIVLTLEEDTAKGLSANGLSDMIIFLLFC